MVIWPVREVEVAVWVGLAAVLVVAVVVLALVMLRRPDPSGEERTKGTDLFLTSQPAEWQPTPVPTVLAQDLGDGTALVFGAPADVGPLAPTFRIPVLYPASSLRCCRP